MMTERGGGSIPPPAKLRTEPHLLRNNLREYGWSPVLVDVSWLSNLLHQEDEESELRRSNGPQMLLKQHVNWETLHESMFDQTKTHSSSVKYRQAESGSPGSFSVEPKQSLELKRSSAAATTTDNDPVHERMKSWITILHAVATAVAKALEWPEDTLIGETRNGIIEDTASSMDLLRAFLYDAIPIISSEVSLGSSPHTDWGSLTVVWQDRTGGLETFCRRTNSWIPVAPMVRSSDIIDDNNNKNNDDDDYLPLIIHIGDVTSLALGGGSDDEGGTWPSPLHRVVSPSNRRRRSLVYFCYPTQKAGSLHNLQDLLKSSDFSKDKTNLEYYSLLQNQSHDDKQVTDARKVYERILHKPLDEVFLEKWSQVQR
jgi:isopenicillin N synthase-like dioxygenase